MDTTDSDISTDSMMATSSDEEENIVFRIRRPKTYKVRINTFDAWSDFEFYYRFRLSKEAALTILNHIQNQISSPSNRYVILGCKIQHLYSFVSEVELLNPKLSFY